MCFFLVVVGCLLVCVLFDVVCYWFLELFIVFWSLFVFLIVFCFIHDPETAILFPHLLVVSPCCWCWGCVWYYDIELCSRFIGYLWVILVIFGVVVDVGGVVW